MKKIPMAVWLLLVLLSSDCSSRRQFVIYNGCKGSWVRIREGKTVLFERIEYGREEPLETSGFIGDTGRTVELVAVGYSLRDNHPMGEASNLLYVPGRSGSLTAPSDLPTWNITWLYSSDSNSGCER